MSTRLTELPRDPLGSLLDISLQWRLQATFLLLHHVRWLELLRLFLKLLQYLPRILILVLLEEFLLALFFCSYGLVVDVDV